LDEQLFEWFKLEFRTGSGLQAVSRYGKGNLADCSSTRWRSLFKVSKRFLEGNVTNSISKFVQYFSHGVAAEGNPRHKPWALKGKGNEPRSGERTRPGIFLSLHPELGDFCGLICTRFSTVFGKCPESQLL
jgi:hypothetical protein